MYPLNYLDLYVSLYLCKYICAFITELSPLHVAWKNKGNILEGKTLNCSRIIPDKSMVSFRQI